MPPPNDTSTGDVIAPRLRSDLVMSEQKTRGRTGYVVKDPISLQYFRLGPQEAYLAGLLNGERTVRQLTQAMQEKFPDADFDEEFTSRIISLFAQMSYLQLGGKQAQQFFTRKAEMRQQQKRKLLLMSLLSKIVYFKIRLCDPDILLLKLEKKVRFLWSKQAVWTLTTLLVASFGLLCWNKDRLASTLPNFLTVHNLIMLWLTMIGVKVVHEFGHGLTCKHFGGEVHEMGAMCIIFTPFLYCDATDSWMFRDKWQKIAVSFAGIYLELFLAGIAAFVWAFTEPGLVNQLAFNIIIVCSVTTVLFNANPLMKFDGYYALADWLEIQNLRTNSNRYLMGWVYGFLTGQPSAKLEDAGPVRRTVFALYAVASYVYVWFVIYRISKFMGYQLEPYGIGGLAKGMAAMTFFGGVVVPFVYLVKQFRQHMKSNLRDYILNRTARMAATAAAIVLLMWIVPWSLKVTRSCVLDGGNAVTIRAESSGFLRVLQAREGQPVRTDQIVARLENELLGDQLHDMEARIKIVELQKQRAVAIVDASSLAQLNAEAVSLDAQRSKLQKEVGALELKAPTNGVVITADMELKLGTYLDHGETLCEVLPNDKLRVLISLDDREAGLVQMGQPVELRIYALPRKVFRGKVAKTFVAPSSRLPHAALASRYGGDVPTEMDATGKERPAQTLYQAELQIDNTDLLLRPGMGGRARISCGRATVGRIISSKFKELLRLEFRL